MESILIWAAALGALVAAILGGIAVWILAARGSQADGLLEKTTERFNRIDTAGERIERELRAEIKDSAQSNRQEIAHSVAQSGQSLAAQITNIATVQNNQIDGFAQQLVKLTDANEVRLSTLQKSVEKISGPDK